MSLDPTARFSSRVEMYARYRPGYPAEVLGLLERECGLTAASRIADIGAGTGLLARLFLDYGCDVTGVEPNPEMRAAAEHALAGHPRFHLVDARAEATTLPPGAFDLVTAGQAFHWFDAAGARAEFQRILKPAGFVSLIWNERRLSPGLADHGFMAEHEELQSEFARERTHPGATEFDAFFGPSNWRAGRLPNSQRLDEEGLRGRMQSSSWSPLPGTDGYAPMMEGLTRLFRKYATDGQVTMEYETFVYYGRLRG